MPLETLHALRSADKVSASQLVRRFGHWQNVANERPVFVLHHGNPRWALMSMPLLSHLADQANPDARAGRLAALHDLTLDHMRIMMIVVDSQLVVRQINAAARAHLSIAGDEALGCPIETILPPSRRTLLGDAAARVRDSGVAETFDFESGLFTSRRLHTRIAPFDGGVALFFEDMSLIDDLAAARTAAAGLAALCEASGRVATGRLTARGLIEHPPPALSAFAGVAADQLHGVRLTSLFDVADRPQVNAAIDAVFEQSATPRLAARLLRHGAQPIPVTLALARTDGHTGLASARYLIVDGAHGASAGPTA